jgi:hypothetical protein
VLVAVPCTQIASDAVCEQIATTALDAALASFGIPPSIPDFDAAVAAAKGDLAELVVEAAGAIPGVATACGLAEAGNTVSSKVQTCEELAGVAIDEIVAEIKQARSDAAATAAGIPAWPGLVLEPDPRGQFQAPAFHLTITRSTDPGLPKTCSVSVYMESTKKGWTFPELHQGFKKDVTADVTGEPFLRTSMLIEPMQPGESMQRSLWLTQTRIWFESQRAQWYWHYLEAMPDDFSRAWVLLTGGSALTFGIQSNCAQPSEQGPLVLPSNAFDF